MHSTLVYLEARRLPKVFGVPLPSNVLSLFRTLSSSILAILEGATCIDRKLSAVQVKASEIVTLTVLFLLLKMDESLFPTSLALATCRERGQ